MNFEDLIIDKNEQISEMMNTLRSLSLKIDKKIEENCYGGKVVQMALYSIGNKNNPTHGISAADDHCKLFFHHFDKIDVSPLKLTGKGKHARHVKFYGPEDIKAKELNRILADILKIAKMKI